MRELFNTLDAKEVFNKIREMKLENKYQELLYPPQPGLFLGNKILFIGQNPGRPRPEDNPTDEILLNENSTDTQFHEAYKQSQLNWRFYKLFIKKIIGDEMNFSISNICFFPTKDNCSPSHEAVLECKNNLIELVDVIKPELIICVGTMPKQYLKLYEIDKKYKIIYSYHYSYLARRGQLNEAIKKIKNELKN